MDMTNSHTKSTIIKNFGYVIATKMLFMNTLCHLGQFFQGKTVVLGKKMYIFLCDFEMHC